MASHHMLGYESWTVLPPVIRSRWLPARSNRLVDVSGRASELKQDGTQARSQAANIQHEVLGHGHFFPSCGIPSLKQL